MASEDYDITCADCQQPFNFSTSEQEFYETKGFSVPKRCKSCRDIKKAARDGGDSYGSRNNYGERESIAGSPAGYSSARAPREFFAATCADCGNQAKVPFKPTSGKPVYCSDCFPNHRP